MARARSPVRAQRRVESIERARERRSDAAARRLVRVEWFIDKITEQIGLGIQQRVRVATDLLRNSVVQNISQPVHKYVGPRGGIVVDPASRSKPGEFPKADTTLLMKTIFGEVMETRPNVWEGFVGTPLDYGLILEVSPNFDRSFLLRTFHEQLSRIIRILTSPIQRNDAYVHLKVT
jgi:hypothetical protein